MLPPRLDPNLVVKIKQSLIARKDWVRYLVLVNWQADKLKNVLSAPADAKFTKFVDNQVQAYIGGTAPPKSIQTAVMNIADDMAAGRKPTLRAGDYVALQTEFQKQR